MINALCGDDNQKWKEVIDISKKALEKRIHLWDFINKTIKVNHLLEKESLSTTFSNV